MNTTKINTDYMYKITDALLRHGFLYKQINNSVCSYTKDNNVFIREKIPVRHLYIYKFTLNNNEVFEKKAQVKKLLQYIETL